MRPLLFLYLFLSLRLVTSAQGTPHAMLWRITPADGGPSSYVLGTVHSADARAYRNTDVVLEAMRQCDLLAGELDFASVKGKLGAGMFSLMIPGGRKLEDLYTKRRYKKVRAALREKLGHMAPMVEHIRPFYLLPVVSQEEQVGDSTRVLDEYLQDVARGKGLEVMGLETMAEQLDAVNGVPLEQQADMLYEAITDPQGRNDTGRMLDQYAVQDLDALVDVLGPGSLPERFSKGLIEARNHVMVQRMDSLMRAGRRGLFAVGAAHLPLADGVLAGLRARGYRLVPLPDSAALREEER